MKQKLFTLIAISFFFLGKKSIAQTGNLGIGTLNPDKSAILDINSSDKGFLMPRLTLDQRDLIKSPAKGLLVYQIDNSPGFYFFDGSSWKSIVSDKFDAKSITAAGIDWSTSGNSGLNALSDFLGTTDNVPLLFRVNNVKAGEINNSTANTYFGFQAGLTGTGVDNVAIGVNSLYTNSTGSSNIGIGVQSLFLNTSGRNNTAIGHHAMRANVNGESNMSIGSFSLSKNTSGTGNMAIGVNALRENTLGNLNTALGTQALFNLTGAGASFNTAIGESSMFGNTSGNSNTSVGFESGKFNITGSKNIFLGYQAGQNELTSEKLYIANSGTSMPLIYGDFSAKYVTIGDVTPALRTQALSLSGGYNLLVKGGILTEKVKVALAVAGTDWADYVFDQSYKEKMMSLEEVEKFTITNKHLPNVPSADEMIKTGLDVSQTSKMFMEKIEELTLYMIEMNKEIKALKAQNEVLKKK